MPTTSTKQQRHSPYSTISKRQTAPSGAALSGPSAHWQEPPAPSRPLSRRRRDRLILPHAPSHLVSRFVRTPARPPGAGGGLRSTCGREGMDPPKAHQESASHSISVRQQAAASHGPPDGLLPEGGDELPGWTTKCRLFKRSTRTPPDRRIRRGGHGPMAHSLHAGVLELVGGITPHGGVRVVSRRGGPLAPVDEVRAA